MREILHIIYRTDKGTVLLLLVALSVLFGVYRLLFEKRSFNNRLVAVMLVASVIATFVPTLHRRAWTPMPCSHQQPWLPLSAHS